MRGEPEYAERFCKPISCVNLSELCVQTLDLIDSGRGQPSTGRSGGRRGIDYASDAQSVFAVDDDDFALGDEASVEQQVHGRVELVVEFDYDSGAEGKHIAQQHAAASETKFDVEADIHEAAVAGRWRGLGQRRFLRTLRRLISRLKLRGEGWADLNFEGDDFMGGRRAGCGCVRGLEADDGVRGPGGRGGGGEMKLHFAAGAWCESGGSKAGDLAQQFLQGFLAFRRDGFGRRGFRRGLGGVGFTKELPGEAGAGGNRQTLGHFAPDGASGHDRVPEIGIGGGQGLVGEFEGTGFSRNLRKQILQTGFPGFAPVAKFDAEFGRRMVRGGVGCVRHIFTCIVSPCIAPGRVSRLMVPPRWKRKS